MTTSCSCASCQKHEEAQKVAFGPLPYTMPASTNYYHVNTCSTLASAFGYIETIETIGAEAFLSGLDDYKSPAGNFSAVMYGLTSSCSLKTYLMDLLYRTWAEGDKSSQLDWDDYLCNTCEHYVSKMHDFDHWDAICGTCAKHATDKVYGTPVSGCSCCSECGYEDCECCDNCGNSPGWCSCCSYCGCEECECNTCRHCEETTYNCSCGSPYSSGGTTKFGSIKKLPWTERSVPTLPLQGKVPTMDDCDNENIDPIQMAADFYLLDAIKNLVRFSAITGSERTMNYLADRDRLVRNNDMLSAVTVSARREYDRLVERLDQNLLAYAVSVVGGELRYHRAASSSLPSSRSSAWRAFTGIVEEHGVDAVFDAVDLFEDFNSNGYGGHKWAQIAQVTAQRLSGKMPAWLFVDRIITLQHNGGCVLNKVSWAKTNGLGWDVGMMQNFLNAHAGCCSQCGSKWEASGCPSGMTKCAGAYEMTDWALLSAAASPGVRHMFQLAEKSLSSIARRSGGDLAVIDSSPQLRKMGRRCRNCGDTASSSGYCYNCSYYN